MQTKPGAPPTQRLAPVVAGLLACVVALTAQCGGSGSSNKAGSADGGGAAVDMLTTRTQSGTVKLPAGVTLPLESLTVRSSVEDKPVSKSGAFSITTFSPNSQLVIALNPNGNPMLMGWLDDSHTVVNAESTAEVLTWFAVGGPLLPDDVLSQVLTTLSTISGLDGVTQAIAASLAADPDTFANPNPTVNAAISQLLAPFKPGAPGMAFVLDDLLIQPGAATPQSGITVTNIGVMAAGGLAPGSLAEPDDPPYTAHIVNKYRRRAWAFVERISHTSGSPMSTPIPDHADIKDFEVWPVNGTNGGVSGALSNILNGWFGNTAYAYAPVDSPRDLATNTTLPFSVPLVDGSSKTTYRVTVVGPGSSQGAAFLPLTAQQGEQWKYICVYGFVLDALGPFVGNVILGNNVPGTYKSSKIVGTSKNSGGTSWTEGATTAWGIIWRDVAKAVTKEILGEKKLRNLMPPLQAFKWNDVMATAIKDFASSGILRTIIINAMSTALFGASVTGTVDPNTGMLILGPGQGQPLKNLVNPLARDAFKAAAAGNLVKTANTILTSVGYALQIFDTLKMIEERSDEHYADSWNLDVTPNKVRLDPPNPMIGVYQFVDLSASAPDVADLTGYSFHWVNTATVGDLGGQNGLSGKDVCASSREPAPARTAKVRYTARGQTGTDTITVDIYPPGEKCCAASSMSCVPGKPLGSAKATVTVAPVILSPKEAQLSCGESQVFTVKVPNSGLGDAGVGFPSLTTIASTGSVLSYSFSAMGSQGHLTPTVPTSVLRDGMGNIPLNAMDNFSSSSPQAKYTVPPGMHAAGMDTITAKAYVADPGDAGTKTEIGEATATVNVGRTCKSTYSYTGNTGYFSGCTKTLTVVPAVVHPSDVVTVVAEDACPEDAWVTMSYAVSATADPPGPPGAGGGGLYNYCGWGTAQPVAAGSGVGVSITHQTRTTIKFKIDPSIQCPVCVHETPAAPGATCGTVEGPLVVMSGVSSAGSGWSSPAFFEIQVAAP